MAGVEVTNSSTVGAGTGQAGPISSVTSSGPKDKATHVALQHEYYRKIVAKELNTEVTNWRFVSKGAEGETYRFSTQEGEKVFKLVHIPDLLKLGVDRSDCPMLREVKLLKKVSGSGLPV